MKKRIRLNIRDFFAPHFDTVFDDIHYGKEHTDYYLSGGRGSAKSSFVAADIITGIMTDPDANALSLRKIDKDVNNSIFNQFLWTLDKMHVSDCFTVNFTKHTFTRVKTGQQIICNGCSDPLSLKSIKTRRGYFKFVWFEEADQFSLSDITSVVQSTSRAGLNRGIRFYTYNPPCSADHWINKHVAELQTQINNGTNVKDCIHHSTYLTVPRDWLGEDFLDYAERLKNTNEKLYKNNYLGEITGTGGQVFENVKPYTSGKIEYVYRGLDFGFAIDPTAYVVVSYDRNNNAINIINEIYKYGASTAQIVEDIKKENKSNMTITADSAEPRTIYDLRNLGLNISASIKGIDSVHHGIRWLQSLTSIYIDKEKCPNTYREFVNYSYKQNKDGTFRSDYPDKDNHSIDAVRYALEQIIRDSRSKYVNVQRVSW